MCCTLLCRYWTTPPFLSDLVHFLTDVLVDSNAGRSHTGTAHLSRMPNLALQVLDSPFSRLVDLMLELATEQQLRIPRPLIKVCVMVIDANAPCSYSRLGGLPWRAWCPLGHGTNDGAHASMQPHKAGKRMDGLPPCYLPRSAGAPGHCSRTEAEEGIRACSDLKEEN